MAKHKLNKTKADLLGQYRTVNADILLKNFTHLPQGKKVVDTCAGYGDLLNWAKKNGAVDTTGYDIEPHNGDVMNDMFATPVNCEGKFVITNPPYLSSNRADDKTPFKKFGMSDLYKCYLASLADSNVEEAIIIQPSNFICESNAKARKVLFENYRIVYAEYWEEKTFPGVAIGIMVMHIKKTTNNTQITFPYLNRTNGVKLNISLDAPTYLFGPKALLDLKKFSKFAKVNIGMDKPNTNIIVSLLDKGKFGLGLSYNSGDAIYCRPKSFTTYQINSETEMTIPQQKQVVDEFNSRLASWRIEYGSMFISNYIDCKQKILSVSYVNKLITLIQQELQITSMT